MKASGDTSILIASATGGAGKEFFSDSEEKTRLPNGSRGSLVRAEGRVGEGLWLIKWRAGDEATQ